MHNFDIKKKSITIAGREVTLETGRMAKQANGAVFMVIGGTSLLATATCSKDANMELDFFPLTVDYIEKMYAAGKIPGGFIKREAKPSVNATLNARLIDRAIRPLFPDGFRNNVHIVITVLSYDGENDPGIMALTATAAALGISDIPFHGPVAGVSVGIINDEIEIYPTIEQMTQSKLDLAVAGTETSIVMIESGASEISEEMMLEATYKGHEEIKRINRFLKEFIAEAGKEKLEIELDIIPKNILETIQNEFGREISSAAHLLGKLERYEAFDNLKARTLEFFKEKMTPEEFEISQKHI